LPEYLSFNRKFEKYTGLFIQIQPDTISTILIRIEV
jgi:hypothetical protein